jgi:hypothetical protein
VPVTTDDLVPHTKARSRLSAYWRLRLVSGWALIATMNDLVRDTNEADDSEEQGLGVTSIQAGR